MSFNTNKPIESYQTIEGQSLFPFLFKVFVKGDIEVYHTPLNGSTYLIDNGLLIITVDGDNGGSVEIPVISGIEIGEGDFIVIKRSLDLNRYVEFQKSGDLLATTLNLDQDYQTYLIADGEARINTALTAPPGIPEFSGELPVPVLEAYLRWNSTATALENDTEPPTWRNETENFKNITFGYMETTEGFMDQSEVYKNKAFDWAETPEDIEVEPLKYSAKHYAAKAAVFNPADYITLETASLLGGFKNKLINGGFDIWQNGTTHTPDMWKGSDVGLPTIKRGAIQYSTKFGRIYPLFIDNGIGSTANVTQYIENGGLVYSEREMFFSVWAKEPEGADMTIEIGLYNTVPAEIDVFTLPISVIDGDGDWIRYGGSFTVPFYRDVYPHLLVRIIGNNVAYPSSLLLINPQLETGAEVTEFENVPLGTTLTRCQRYYEKWSGSVLPVPYLRKEFDIGTRISNSIAFNTTKRIAPSVTGTLIDGTFIVWDTPTAHGFGLYGIQNGSQTCTVTSWIADARLWE